VANAANQQTAAAPNPFDPESLRLSQDDAAIFGVKKVLVSIPVRKPHKTWFVRVHTDKTYWMETFAIDLGGEQETYLVTRALWASQAGESAFRKQVFFTAINRQGDLFLWPINLPGQDGKMHEATRSALEAVKLAKEGWIRVSWSPSLGAYEVHQANGELPDPEWPNLDFKEITRVAFRDRRIDAIDHPVLKKLRGEV
jgi:hypothetical protein